MSIEPVHGHEPVEPLRHAGPGRAWRARTVAGGGAFAPGSDVLLRVLTESEAGGAGSLDAVAAAHDRARTVASPCLLVATEFGIDAGPAGRTFWSAAPWPSARSLGALLATVDVVPDPLTEAIAKGACDALVAAHAAGFVGVGLAPDAILLHDDGSVVLADVAFGAAESASWPAEGAAPTSLLCAAPETIAAGRADERSDLYALGAILFRCMTGRWHRPDDARAVRSSAGEMLAPAPADERSGASHFLSEVVRALLRTEPEDRFATSAELAVVLTERRRGAWWRHLAERQGGDVAPAVVEPEPSPGVVAEPPGPPPTAWFVERRSLGIHLGEHPTPCVGRARELEVLADAVASLRQGGGGVVLVEGVAGVGKSRLLDALLDRLTGEPSETRPTVLLGEHRRLGIGRPFGALTEALTRFIASDRVVSAAEVAPLLGEMSALAGPFAAFLSGETPPHDLGRELTAPTLASAFVRCLRTLCAGGPVIVLIENLQWTDTEGLDLFAHVAAATDDLPLLLIGTHRPAEAGTALATLLSRLRTAEGVDAFTLQQFSPVEMEALVGAIVTPPDAARRLADRIRAQLGGSPLLAVETLRALASDGALAPTADGRLAARPSLATASIPADEEAVFRRRLAPLSPEERTFLDGASAQGVRFDADVARRAAGLDGPAAQRVITALGARGLLEGEGVARRFSSHGLFDHVLECVDDDFLRRQHSALASAFLASRNPDGSPPEKIHGMLAYRVAWHHLAAGETELGRVHLPAAVEHLRATWRLGDGDRLTALACRAYGEDPALSGEHVGLLLARAEFLGRQARHDDVRDVLDEALALARELHDPAREACVLLASARARFALGRNDAAGEAEEALVAARRASDLGGELRAQVLLAEIAVEAGRVPQARAHHSEALEIARRLNDTAAEADALHALGDLAQASGALDQAEELLRAALRAYRLRGDIAREAESLTSLARVGAMSGDLADAEACLQRSLRIHTSLGDTASEAQDYAQLGLVLQEAGRLGEAREAHRAAALRHQDLGIPQGVAVAELNLATTECALGRIDEARDVYGDALRIAKDLGDERLQGFALTGLGEVARQRGAFRLSRDLLQRAVPLFRRAQDPGGLAAALLAGARAEAFSGDAPRARAMAVEAHRLALQQNAQQAAALAGSILALLDAREGRSDDAERRMAQAGLDLVDVRTTDVTFLECLFVQSLVLRVLGRSQEADRKVIHAESVANANLGAYPEDARPAVAAGTSPFREVFAGAAAARASAGARPRSMSETVAV